MNKTWDPEVAYYNAGRKGKVLPLHKWEKEKKFFFGKLLKCDVKHGIYWAKSNWLTKRLISRLPSCIQQGLSEVSCLSRGLMQSPEVSSNPGLTSQPA